MGSLPLQGLWRTNRPISPQPEGQAPFRAHCVVTKPAQADAWAWVLRLALHPEKVPARPQRGRKHVLRCIAGRADHGSQSALRLGGLHAGIDQITPQGLGHRVFDGFIGRHAVGQAGHAGCTWVGKGGPGVAGAAVQATTRTVRRVPRRTRITSSPTGEPDHSGLGHIRSERVLASRDGGACNGDAGEFLYLAIHFRVGEDESRP